MSMNVRTVFSGIILSLFYFSLQAQIKNPVTFKTELNSLSDTEAEIVFTAAIDKGWHVYSTDLGDGGPISATFNAEKKSGVELVSKLKPVGKEVATFDKLFEMKVRYFKNTAKFVQKLKLTGGAYAIEGYLEYGACDDESCLPPTEVPFKFSGEAKAGTTAAPVAKADKPETKKTEEVTAPAASEDSVAMMEPVPSSATDANADIQPAVVSGDLWRPVISELQALGEEHTQEDIAVYMVPGLWGAPLKVVSAFAPPMQTQDFNLHKNDVHAKFDDYDLGMEYARLNGKPVMLDFTGYGCVNCRKMEAAVWTDPKVSDLINNDYVLITLYVDNKTPLTEPVKIIENGTERTLRTVGDKWSYLQRVKFGANAQPFYVLLDNQGSPLNKSYAYDEDIANYVEFLQVGLKSYSMIK